MTGDIAGELDGQVVLGPFNTDRVQAKDSPSRLAEVDVDVLAFGDREAFTPATGRLAAVGDPLG